MSSAKIKIYRTFSSEETKALGADVARALSLDFGTASSFKKGAAVIALHGDLGAGKTTFVQGFLKGLGSRKRAASPTFILVRRHALSEKKFRNAFHVDAYRLKRPEHAAVLGLDAVMGDARNVVLVEWPERMGKFLPKRAMHVAFRHGKKEHERTIIIKGQLARNHPRAAAKKK